MQSRLQFLRSYEKHESGRVIVVLVSNETEDAQTISQGGSGNTKDQIKAKANTYLVRTVQNKFSRAEVHPLFAGIKFTRSANMPDKHELIDTVIRQIAATIPTSEVNSFEGYQISLERRVGSAIARKEIYLQPCVAGYDDSFGAAASVTPTAKAASSSQSVVSGVQKISSRFSFEDHDLGDGGTEDDGGAMHIEPATDDKGRQFIVRPKNSEKETQVTLATLENLVPNVDVKLMQSGVKYTAGEFFHLVRVLKDTDTIVEDHKNTLLVQKTRSVKAKAMAMAKFEAVPQVIERDDDDDEMEVDREG